MTDTTPRYPMSLYQSTVGTKYRKNIVKGVDKSMFYLFRPVHYIEVDMDDDEEVGGIYYAIQVNLTQLQSILDAK